MATPNGGTWIYINRVDRRSDPTILKIGQSTKRRGVRNRQHESQDVYGDTTHALLAELRAEPKDERALHRHFAAERLVERFGPKTELFSPSKRLLGWVRWMRDQPFVATDDETEEEREAKPHEDFERWKPAPGREKEVPRSNLPLFPALYDELEMPPRDTTPDDYYTGEQILDCARAVLGEIDLDPASHAVANRKVRARKIFTVSDDGLAQPWAGNVWLNPPFSEWQRWAEKVIKERPSLKQLCVLVATRTITAKYFAPLLDECDAQVIIHGRLPFWGKLATSSPDDGHMVLYFGENTAKFAEEFARIGTVFVPHRARVEVTT